MWNFSHREVNVSHLDSTLRVVVINIKSVIHKRWAVEGSTDGLQNARASWRQVKPDPVTRFLGPVEQRVGEWDEVKDVITMRMADYDRVKLPVVNATSQLAEHTVPAINKNSGCVRFHEVAAAGTISILPGGGTSDDRDFHSCSLCFLQLGRGTQAFIEPEMGF